MGLFCRIDRVVSPYYRPPLFRTGRHRWTWSNAYFVDIWIVGRYRLRIGVMVRRNRCQRCEQSDSDVDGCS